MTGRFACPECGDEVNAPGLAPGRQVRCGGCATLIEVPFFPRVVRRRSQRPDWRRWGLVGVAVAIGVIVSVEAGRALVVLARTARDRVASRGIPERVDVEARLDALKAGDSESATAGYAQLLGEVAGVPGLADLEAAIRSAREQTWRDSARTDLDDATEVLEEAPGRAVVLCERAIMTADRLERDGEGFRAEARSLVSRIARRLGVVLEPARGEFLLGSGPAFDEALGPCLVTGLGRRGYVTVGEDSPFRSLWERDALYRAHLVVDEAWGGNYLESPSRISLIRASIDLSHAGAILWHADLQARTRSPLSEMSAFGASRLILGTEPDPIAEHRFHEDALDVLLGRLATKLQQVPPPTG